nr:MAG TPA: hypothetical protein [Bacteriophage sp.]
MNGSLWQFLAVIVSAWQFQRAIIVVSKKGQKATALFIYWSKKDW